MKLHLPFLLILGLLTTRGLAQQEIKPSHPDYDRLKSEGLLPQQQPGFYKVKQTGEGTTIVPMPAEFKAQKKQSSAANSKSSRGGGQNESCNCFQELDDTYEVVPFTNGQASNDYRNDDGSTAAIPLPFEYCLYGDIYNEVFINNNGNISFNNTVGTFSSEAFPNDFVMVAPFWGDVDTRNNNSGVVYYKVTEHALIVIWDRVGYFNSAADKVNSFQVIITDGTDPIVPFGFNTGFCYGDMQWTTGDASNGTNGFGGIPATVGANRGNSQDYVQFGRFDQAGNAYDGPFNTSDGVSWLDDQTFFFNTCTEGGNDNVPPVPIATDICDTIYLCEGQIYPFNLNFFAVEPTQTCSTTITPSPTPGLLVADNVQGNINVVSGTFTAQADNIGMNAVTFTCTDNGTPAASTSITAYFRVVENNFVVPITGLDTICEGTCSELSVGTFDSYNWSTGESTPTITICEPGGPFTVTVTVGGCNGTSPPFNIVQGDIEPPVIVAEDSSLCNGQFTFISVEGFYSSYSWPLIGQNSQQVEVGPGTYEVIVTAESGCTASAEFTVELAPTVAPIIVAPDSLCGAATAAIYTTEQYDTYQWTTGSTNDTVTVGPGFYAVTVTLEGFCTASSPPVQIFESTTITPIIQGPQHTCFDFIVPLQTTQEYASYEWSTGSVTDTILVNQGTFTVSVTDTFGCAGTSAPFIVTNSAPDAEVLGITDFCDGDSILLNSPGNYVSYIWTSPTGDTLSTADTLVFPGDSLYLNVTDEFGCFTTELFIIEPTPLPEANFTPNPSLTYIQLPEANISYTDNSNPAPGDSLIFWTYFVEPWDGSWEPGDDQDTVVFNTPDGSVTIQYPDTGFYTITMLTVSQLGCVDTVQYTIYVFDEVYVPNAFSPNGDGFNDVFKIPFLSGYPENQVLIYNRWGRKVYEATNYKDDWDADNLPSGTYFYVVSAPTLEQPLKGTVTVFKED